MGLPRGSGVGGSARELIGDRLAERGQVCRRAAGDQVAVNADFLVYDGGASVAKIGAHAGIRRERAIPDYVGSTRVHGPWEMAATGLPDRTKSRTKATADSSSRNLSGLTVPPGSTRTSKSRRRRLRLLGPPGTCQPTRGRVRGPESRQSSGKATEPARPRLRLPRAVVRVRPSRPRRRPRWRPCGFAVG